VESLPQGKTFTVRFSLVRSVCCLIRYSELLSLQYATTSQLNHTHVPTLGRIKSFSVNLHVVLCGSCCLPAYQTATFLNDENKRLIGDDQGWLYSYRETPSQDWNELNPELNLHALSEVTALLCIHAYFLTSST
jgi:WD repeat-containing protein 21A